MKPSIQFHYLFDRGFYFPRRKNLKKFILILFNKEGFAVDTINYIFCSDSFLLKINQKFLKHNSFTDIITFQLSDNGQPIISDIYISVDRIKYNSKSFAISFKDELHRAIFHGALHLCGYEDKGLKEGDKMKEREDFYLGKYLK